MNQTLQEMEKAINDSPKKAGALFENEKHLKYYRNIALNPLILSQKEYDNIRYATESVGKLLEKTVKLYFSQKKVTDFFAFNARQKKIISTFNPKMRSIYLARFDGAIINQNNFQFIEFNVNHPGGTERLDKITQIILDFYHKSKINLENINHILADYLKTVKNIYDKRNHDGIFVLAYGSTFLEYTRPALEILRDLISKKINQKVIITNFENLKYDGKRLKYQSENVSVIYRAELLHRFWQYDFQATKQILQAIRDGNVIMYNQPIAHICGVKNLFALWHEKWFLELLSQKEQDVIKKYVPLTYSLNSKNISHEELMKDKDNWVIKPISGFGGSRVYIGKVMTMIQWSKKIISHFGNRHWIAQKFIKNEKYPIIDLDTKNNTITKKTGYLNISPWLIDGKMAGISVRYSKNLIVSIVKGGGIMTSTIVK